MILREFMIEGVVTLCVCEMEPKRFVCTSESVESGPGIRSRLTIDIADRWSNARTEVGRCRISSPAVDDGEHLGTITPRNGSEYSSAANVSGFKADEHDVRHVATSHEAIAIVVA